MTTQQSFSDYVTEILPMIDSYLASCQIAVKQRPFRAALEFVQHFILEVEIDGVRGRPELERASFVSERWFSVIYRSVEGWYRDRYGSALSEADDRTIGGFVLIWGTPFALEIPGEVVRPGKPGETIWLRFPDCVLDYEDPADWLISPPNLSAIPEDEKGDVIAAIREISGMLRSINTKRMGIAEDSVVEGLLDQAWNHVQAAARNIRGRTDSGVYWDIQMACECAYKMLLQVRAGTFPRTHNLRRLHKLAQAQGLNLPVTVLDCIPESEEMIDMRYGQAGNVILEGFYEAYREMLKIVDAALAPVVKLILVPYRRDSRQFGNESTPHLPLKRPPRWRESGTSVGA